MALLRDQIASISPIQLFALSLLFFVPLIRILQNVARYRSIPGPLVAKFTDLWRLIVVWRRDSHETFLSLHEKHGDLVRIGPNCISISKPDVIQSIYGIGKGYIKSDFYAVWQNMIDGKRVASLVFTTDEAVHAKMKRPIAQAYSLSTLVEFEPLIDSTTAVFLSRLDELFSTKDTTCDLGKWLGWYAFDVIGELTLSKRLGFLETAHDVEGISASVAKNFDRCSVLGQMPWLDLVTYKNPIYQKLFAKPVSSPIIGFGQRRLSERLEGTNDFEDEEVRIAIQDKDLEAKILHGTIPSKPDFLSRFLKLHEEQPEVVTDRQLLAYLFMNINAGSDTISSTLRATFYYLLKDTASLNELVTELQGAQRAGKLSEPLPTWTECQHLPYLNAVIKEGLRLNPPLSLPLERVVPSEGLQIGDTFIPSGTVVGINPWVLHRDRRIFGEDAGVWNPNRWIDTDDEKSRYMEQHLLSFGAGKRTCLGRHIAMLEMTKLVPALVMRYEMQLAYPKKEWRVVNAWAIRQEGLEVNIARRRGS